MPMQVLTLLQTAAVFGAYLFVSVGLPAFVFGRKLTEHRMLERFLLYFMIGNFYIINLVYLLQLLKISYPVTLALGTYVPALLARLRLNRTPVREIAAKRLKDLKRLADGSMGRRTALFRLSRAAGKQLKRGCRFLGGALAHHPVDCLLLLAFLALLCWLQGSNLIEIYGFKASDIPVHNFWVNSMCENHIFVSGIYPHGFHCVVYYLHVLFGMPTFAILRVFGFVESVMVHVVLWIFLKLCCKSRFAPYLGVFLFAGSSYLTEGTYWRFHAALPQEFGMMFILPPVYFGFAYFSVRKRELEKEGAAGKKKSLWKRLRSFRAAQAEPEPPAGTKTPPGESGAELLEGAKDLLLEGEGAPLPKPKPAETPEFLPEAAPEPRKRRFSRLRKLRRKHPWHWRPSQLYLAGFAMSFSLSFTVHFYGTVIAGLFCMAMAVGYGFLFLRKEYFWNVVSTVMLSIAIAILPMLLAFMGGTKLHGSMAWGMSVIKSSQGQEEAGEDREPSAFVADIEEGPEENAEPLPELTPRERLERLRWFTDQTSREMLRMVVRLPQSKYATWLVNGFFALMGMGALLFLLRQRCYGAMMISTGIYLFFLGIMQCAPFYGLPALMDGNRASIYVAYSLPLLLSFGLDSVLTLLFLPFQHKLVMHTLSLAFVALVLWHTWDTGWIRPVWEDEALERNEAIACMENVVATEEDFTWTIVSANDELQMGLEYGYHYEIITFLQDMEGVEDWSEIQLRIPTPVVYIFIEKIPVTYLIDYPGAGQPVSEEGANRPLPGGGGISMYQGEPRWVLMSRMYYWAQEFQKLYPNEMEVYMETDGFICYRIEQNMYRLYDFGIDYGYNTRDYTLDEGGAG